MINADPQELAKFSELAHLWWDPDSDFRPLHRINPLRLDWIDATARLAGKRVLDVGCGGGILSDAMARRGARVLGIDLATKPLRVAQLHALEAGTRDVEYREVAVENETLDFFEHLLPALGIPIEGIAGHPQERELGQAGARPCALLEIGMIEVQRRRVLRDRVAVVAERLPQDRLHRHLLHHHPMERRQPLHRLRVAPLASRARAGTPGVSRVGNLLPQQLHQRLVAPRLGHISPGAAVQRL